MTEPAVTLTAVEKRFGDHLAVAGIDLEIGRGEFFSLLGPSGCGKTTTLRMIAGFEHPTAGTLSLMGEDATGVAPHRRVTNMVFQNYALFPHLSVFENVAFGLKVKKVDPAIIPERVARSLALVRLEGMEKRKPGQLSGGQQQRVALARALVNEPQVLLLDEPLGALDEKLRREMQFELKRIQREIGITFIYVTHDQEEALTMSDRIAVMSHGKVLQVDPPEAIYDRPRSRFVAEFIGSANFLDAVVTGSSGQTVATEAVGLGSVAAEFDGAAPAAGTPVTLVVRPERLMLDGGSGSGFAGTVADAVFVGEDTLVLVEVGGRTVSVRRPNDGHAGRVVKRGDRVTVTIGRAWLLP